MARLAFHGHFIQRLVQHYLILRTELVDSGEVAGRQAGCLGCLGRLTQLDRWARFLLLACLLACNACLLACLHYLLVQALRAWVAARPAKHVAQHDRRYQAKNAENREQCSLPVCRGDDVEKHEEHC